MTEPVTVTQALTAVMAELPNIGKGDKSPEGYIYRGIEAVTKHVQPLLAKHGVIISPRATVVEVVPSPAMKEGWQDVYMQVEWTVTGPDGSTLTAQTNGIGRDRADKGANKAQTQAFKYLLLHLLCIADGKDDADGQTYEHDRYEQTAPKVPVNVDDVAHMSGRDVNEQLGARGLQQGGTLEAMRERLAEALAADAPKDAGPPSGVDESGSPQPEPGSSELPLEVNA